MLIPIGLLALGAVFAGQIFHGTFINAERAPEFWRGAVAFSTHLAEASEHISMWAKFAPTIAMLLGLWIAWNNYIRDPSAAGTFVRTFPAVHRFVLNKWYFDEIYDRIFVRPALWLGGFFWHRGDEKTIDRFGPHGAAVAVAAGNRIAARVQSGYLYSYALVMLLGLIGAATWAIWWAR
jgi:NADH-quinone oxidoreductase subunit L